MEGEHHETESAGYNASVRASFVPSLRFRLRLIDVWHSPSSASSVTACQIARGGTGNDTFGAVADSALAGDVDQLFGDAGNDLLIAKGRPVDGWTASFDGGADTDTVRAGGDIRHYTFTNVEVLESTNTIVATAAQFNQFSLFTDILPNGNPSGDVTSYVITTAGTVDFSARLDASVIKLDVTGSIDGNTIIGGGGDDVLRGYFIPFGGGPGPASVHLEGRGGNDTLNGSLAIPHKNLARGESGVIQGVSPDSGGFDGRCGWAGGCG